MAATINIRLVSNAQLEGFKQAESELKKLEDIYNTSLKSTLGSIPKMVKAYETILKSGKETAAKDAGAYFQNWAKALINNFSGGDAGKLRNQLEKSISQITNIGGSDNMAFINTTSINEQLKEVAQVYNDTANDTYSASQRKQAAFEQEQFVLKELGLETEAYSSKLQYLKSQMLSMGTVTDQNRQEFQKLAEQYKQTKNQLDELTASQNKGIGRFGQYIGVTLKSMLTHQALASAIRMVTRTIKESVQAASTAEQVFNKLNTVYAGFEKTAKQAASELASSIGVANSTAASALSTVGDLLQAQNMGVAESLKTATDWVSKFQDIINFKDINMTLEEFAQSFMAGIAGNTRNLRTFGSIVKESAVNAELTKQGLDKLTGSQLELAKMVIRANMALDQQKNAWGATNREWDTALSINRRLNEQQKQMKENLGETINKGLVPLKRVWTDILTEINKTTKAQKEYNEAAATGAALQNAGRDVQNNVRDLSSFLINTRSILTAYGANQKYGVEKVDGYATTYMGVEKPTEEMINIRNSQKREAALKAAEEEWNTFINNVFVALAQYGVTVEQFGSMMRVSQDILNALIPLEEENNRKLREQLALENRQAEIEKLNSGYESFTEALKAITGVNIFTRDMGAESDAFAGMENGATLFSQNIKESTLRAVDDALVSIGETMANDIGKWGDVIEGQLDELDMADLLESVAASYKTLFTQTWNEFWSNDSAIDSEEQERLDSIKSSYQSVNKELEKYNKSLQAQEALLKSYETAQESINERAGLVRYTGMGYSDDVATLMYQKGNAEMQALADFNSAYGGDVNELGQAVVLVGNHFLTLSQIVDTISKDYEEQIALIEEENRLQRAGESEKKNSATGDYFSFMAGLSSGRPGEKTSVYSEVNSWYEEANNQLSSLVKSMADAGVSFEELVAYQNKGTASIKEEYEKRRELIDSLKEQEALAYFTDKANPMSDTMNTFKEGAEMGSILGIGETLGGILSVLLDMWAQTEVFQEISSFLSDAIIPVLDAFLKPLIPVIELMTELVQEIIFGFLEPFFPILKLVASAIVIAGSILKTLYYIIYNIYAAVNNILQRLAHPISGGNRMSYKSITDPIKEMTQKLTQISEMTFKIEKNTDKSNSEQLKAYNEMFRQKLITASEYNSLVAGLSGITSDRMNTYNGTAWQNGSGGTTIIYYGDLRFEIDGTNLSADQIAQAVTRKQKEWASTAHYN